MILLIIIAYICFGFFYADGIDHHRYGRSQRMNWGKMIFITFWPFLLLARVGFFIGSRF